MLQAPHISTSRLTASVKRSRLHRYRDMLREPIAEFLGVAILVIFGCGVNCSVLLSSAPGISSYPKGDYLAGCFGWAIGLCLGVWVAGGVSPAHINPAVTLAMATWRGFAWRKVPVFIFAQLLGGFVGAALVYGTYFHAIDTFEGGVGIRTLRTAGLFSAYSIGYMTNISFAMNPARDFGPRLLTAAVGYPGTVFSFRHQYWLWNGIIAPIVGAQLAVALYDIFLCQEEDSLVLKKL
ncbi:aquaporin-like protein [Favolaschia claudopus]|uniref:Aquaporin-like protein n=1 Tax=Favolaschia claudopus TaxID=2862362 RepID=A0AAW0AS52_9AGAR